MMTGQSGMGWCRRAANQSQVESSDMPGMVTTILELGRFDSHIRSLIGHALDPL